MRKLIRFSEFPVQKVQKEFVEDKEHLGLAYLLPIVAFGYFGGHYELGQEQE